MDNKRGYNVTFSGKEDKQIAIFNGTLMYVKSGGYSCRCLKENKKDLQSN